MTYFIIRGSFLQIRNTPQAQDYTSSVTEFSSISDFALGVNIVGIEYHPGVLHEVTYGSGSRVNLPVVSAEYDDYIANISLYKSLLLEMREQLASSLAPQTLVEAKTRVNNDIYLYSSTLIEDIYRNYSIVERNRWPSVILPEAKSYLATKNPVNAPNLVQQEIIRTNIADTYSPEFETSLTTRVQNILDQDAQAQESINFYCGIRGKWLDYVENFAIQAGETELDAIQRLLDLDWRIGWDLPN